MLGRAVLVAALALSAPGTAAAAESFTVARPVASLRNAPASFAIGHVFAGDRVEVVARSGDWVYAAAGGRCAWLMDRGLRPAGTSATTCPSPGTLDPSLLFARGSYQRGCGEGCVYPARVTACPDRTVYANYDPATTTFLDPSGREPVRRGTRGRTVPRYRGARSGYAGFGTRYVTRDGAATLIKDTHRRHGPTWVFMRSECVERLSLPVTGSSIGRLRLGERRARAVRAFGRLYERDGCRMTWRKLALTLHGCRRITAATVGRQPVRGMALIHTWATARGLRVGDRVRVLRRLYPHARRRGGIVALEPGLRAAIARGRVDAFRLRGRNVNCGWVGRPSADAPVSRGAVSARIASISEPTRNW